MQEYNIDTPIFYDSITLDSLLNLMETAEQNGLELAFPVSGDKTH